MSKHLKSLMKRLDYTFNDITLLETALRHRSMGAHNNERLEFLGDSVVNCVVAKALFHQFPKGAEGELSRLRAQVVNRDFLAQLGQGMALGEVLELGSGELKSGGFRRASILADAFEAVVGAIVLDSDFDTAEACLLRWYAKPLADMSLEGLQKDAKTGLQEWLQSRSMALPIYQVDGVEGQAHDQTFKVSCRVDGMDFTARGEGYSRRKAEQCAAQVFLEWIDDESK
jgi:ribonuclease III